MVAQPNRAVSGCFEGEKKPETVRYKVSVVVTHCMRRDQPLPDRNYLMFFIGFVCLGIHIYMGTQDILRYICQNYALGYCIPQGYYPCWGMPFSMNKYRGQ